MTTTPLPADEIKLPAIPESILATAPDHIWLDLGEEMHLIDHETKFRDLGGVTWSEDNATGCGIEYVRADRATAASAVADTLERFNLWRRTGDEAVAQPQPKEIGEAIDAAVSMLRARAAVDAEGWISVETRLPEKDEPVLVFNPNGAMPIMIDEWCTYREAPVGWSSATIETGDGWAQHEFEQITHWRAIPAAPGPASPTPAAAFSDPDDCDAACPRCDGSGEEEGTEGQGPDAYTVTINCQHCNGAGSLLRAYRGVCETLAKKEKAWGAATLRRMVQPADDLQGCACRWRGDQIVSLCEVHAAWRETLHEQAEQLRANRAVPAPHVGDVGGEEEAVRYADQIETEVMEILNGTRKPGRLSVEPIVKLCAYVRTGSTSNATLASDTTERAIDAARAAQQGAEK